MPAPSAAGARFVASLLFGNVLTFDSEPEDDVVVEEEGIMTGA